MKTIGKEVEIQHNAPRPGDVKDSLADISRAKEMFGFEPKFNLNEGIKETLSWFQK